MDETIEQLLIRAESALHDKKFADTKKYVDQALKQTEHEKDVYLKHDQPDDKKEEFLSVCYSRCGFIFFQTCDYLKSIACSYTASVFSETFKIDIWQSDIRWIKLLLEQPRKILLARHERLKAFVSEELVKVANVAVKCRKWEKCLQIDQIINDIFIWLRDVHSIGPDMIWHNPGRHEAFLRMAKTYYNLNDQENTRLYCKLVLDHLSEYNNVKALELFARSLLKTESFKSALKYCKLAINSSKTGEKAKLERLKSDIEKGMSATTFEMDESILRDIKPLKDQRTGSQVCRHSQKKKESISRRRPNRAKRLEKNKKVYSQFTNILNDASALKQTTTIIYERTSQGNENENKPIRNKTDEDGKPYLAQSENKKDGICSNMSTSSHESDTDEFASTSSDGDMASDDHEYISSSSDEEIPFKDTNTDTDVNSFYEASKSTYNNEKKTLSISDDEMADLSVVLNPTFLKKFEDRHFDILKRKKMYREMIPVSELHNLLEDEQRYVRGNIEIQGAHEAICIPTHTAHCSIPIKIEGRGKIGQTFNHDKVVAEITHDRKTAGQRFGRIIGIFDLTRHESMKQNVYACTIDADSSNLVRPICKIVPKISVLHREISKKYKNETEMKNKIELYDYNKMNGTLSFSEIIHLNSEQRKSCIVLVAYINWSPMFVYPRGAILRVLQTGQNLKQDLTVQNIIYKVPSFYKNTTVKEVDVLLNNTKSTISQIDLDGRQDLTDLWTVTIDPKGSEDLDDALSIEDLENVFKIGIHIADVSSYVKQGSAVDHEARSRSQTFYSNIHNSRCMLPEPISKNICSLLPNEIRLTLTVFVYFAKEDFTISKTEIQKTYISSKEKLSYKEVQDLIADKKELNQTNIDINRLSGISKHLREKRLKNASYALESYWQESPLDSEDFGTSDAHSLVEEFMILANRTVAEKLLKSNHRQCIPIRCHRPPSDEDIKDFLKDNDDFIDIVCQLQDKQIGTKRPNFNSKIDTQNKRVMVFKSIWEKMKTNDAAASNYLRKDDLHPLQHIIFQRWLEIQESAEFKCSGTLKENEGNHYGLDIFPYTNFTSPIRRYIDLVVHRLVHATLLQQTDNCPYSMEEIEDICQHANFVSRKAKGFERGCRTLKLAEELGRKPRIFTCYVSKCSEGEITFCTPSLKGQSTVKKEIPFNLIDLAEKPYVIDDVNTNSNKVRAIWRKRFYNFCPNVSTAKQEDIQELNPFKDIVSVPMQKWIQMLQSITDRRNTGQKSGCMDIVHQVKIVPSKGVLDVSTEHCSLTEDEETKGLDREKTFVFQPSTKFSMVFSRGQRLNIQMAIVHQTGTTTLKPTLLDMTHNVKFCLQHTDDPVLHLSQYSSNATRDRYKDIKSYRDIWLPIISMEAAKVVIRNEESCCLNDVKIHFGKDRTGKIILDVDECKMRNIEFSGTVFEKKDQDLMNTKSYDWLCIKTSRPVVKNDGKSTASYIWVGHGQVTNVTQRKEKVIVLFNLHEASKYDSIIFDQDSRFHVEILKKSEVDRRTESFIWELEEDSLATNIALRKSIPDLDEECVEMARGLDKDLKIKIKDDESWKPLPRNNKMQDRAIERALTSRFTLIQGPPGTGKTQTAIKLICLFTKINNTSTSGRKQVLFCGPSNKSVDLVAKWMLNRMGEHRPKFVRVYGSTIETEKFPVPGRSFLSKKSTRSQSADPGLESVSLHCLIRETGNVYAGQILALDKLFAQNRKKPMPKKEIEYIKLIAKASIAEMQKYDVILCTTAVGTNPKLLKATAISQIIVDEAGMCPEPNCLVPIIATKATQVILIGDHKQLRPIIMCKEAASLGLDKSLFERYANNPSATNVAFVMLNEQYRMHPEICQFPSEQFYGGALKTKKMYEKPLSIWPKQGHVIYPHVFVQIEGEEKSLTVSTNEGNEQSKSNLQEVEHVIKVYRYLTSQQPSDTVQIISQYNAQCHKIREELAEEGFPDVNVSTVVSSQGGEWDYVIFSTVRSLPPYKIERNPTLGWCIRYLGFITDKNQVNVALTRAKKGLIIIGNKHLLACDEVWKELIDYYEVRGCVLTPDKFPPQNKKTRQQIMAEEKEKHRRRHGDTIFKKGQATSFKGPIDGNQRSRRK